MKLSETPYLSPLPRIVHPSDWADPDYPWKGHLQGKDLGTQASLVMYATQEIGQGPRWHVHPYDEIFIVRKGNALFTIGETRLVAQEGDILMGPAGVPHKYHNLGPGPLESIDVHLSQEWIQTNLPDPGTEDPFLKVTSPEDED